MAKIKTSDYIDTLQAILEESTPASHEENFAGFLQLLRSHRQLGLINNILNGLRERLDATSNSLTAQVQAPAPLTPGQKNTLQDFLADQFHVQNVNLEISTDASRPGIITTARDRRYDWSLERQLLDFRKQLLA